MKALVRHTKIYKTSRISMNIAFPGLPGGPFGALLGRLGALLGRPGTLLGRLGGLGPSWGPLGALLGTSCGPLRALLGTFRGPLGTLLGRHGLSWAVLEPFWAVLGPSWGPLGPSWGGLGSLLGRLGHLEEQRSEYAENVRFPMGMGRFLPLGAPLGGLLRRRGGLLGRLEAIFGPL